MSALNSSVIGHRNKRARESRRQRIKEECDCDSVPQSDRQERKLTLNENFGWKVVEMTHVESSFPHLARYYEKPDVSGQFEKVTHVLCMGKPATVTGRRPSRRGMAKKEGEASKPEVEEDEEVAKRKVEEREEAAKPEVDEKEEAAKPEVEATDQTWKLLSHSTQPPAVSWSTCVTNGAQVDSKLKRKDTPYIPHARSAEKSEDGLDRSPRNSETGRERDQRLETAKDALLRRLREERETRRSLCSDTVRMSATVDERKRATREMFDRIDSWSGGGGSDKAKKEEEKKVGNGKLQKLIEKGNCDLSRKMAEDRLERTDSSDSEGSSDVTGKRENMAHLRAGSSKPRLKKLTGEMKIAERTVEDTVRKKLTERRRPAQKSVSETSSSGSPRGKEMKMLKKTIEDVTINKLTEKSPRAASKTSSGCTLQARTGEINLVQNGKVEEGCLAKEDLARKNNVKRKPRNLVKASSRSAPCNRGDMVDPPQNLVLGKKLSKQKNSFYTEGTMRKEQWRREMKGNGKPSSGQNIQERTCESMRTNVGDVKSSATSLESMTNHDKATERAFKPKTKKSVGQSLTNDDRTNKETEPVFNLIESRHWDYDEMLKWMKAKERQRVGSGSVAKKSSGRIEASEEESTIVRRPVELKTLEGVTELDFGDGENYEQLLQTPSGSNKYLYVPIKK